MFLMIFWHRQNGVLHICSRSLVFDQDQTPSTSSDSHVMQLPHLAKFRYNSNFDYEVASGQQLEAVH